MRSTTVTLNHRSLGSVEVKIDTEDKKLFKENRAVIQTSSVAPPRIRFNTLDGRPYAARTILAEHGKLTGGYVYYKNGDQFDLRKSNLIQK